MAISLSTPVTGASQTGFTSPTYTVAADVAPDVNGKQWAVTALGGTQTGVTTHSASSPFSVSFFRPKTYRSLGNPNPTTGIIAQVPMNRHKVIVRKGVTPLAGQPLKTLIISCDIDIPAGADTADAPNVRAALSAFIGSLSQISAGLGDTTVTGII